MHEFSCLHFPTHNHMFDSKNNKWEEASIAGGFVYLSIYL